MQENELPKNMGKKIVDALKQQDFEETDELHNETSMDEFVDSDEISLDSLGDTSEADAFDFGSNSKEYTPVFSVNEEEISPNPEMKLSIENDEDVEEFEMPNNINVLKRLISQLPTGVPRQTGAQIIRQTLEAMGIPMNNVLKEAQEVQEELNSSTRECMLRIQEYKTNILQLEQSVQEYQKNITQINDLVSLFLLTDRK